MEHEKKTARMITAKEARKITEDCARTDEYNQECIDEIMHEIIGAAKTGDTEIEVAYRLLPNIGTSHKLVELGYRLKYREDYILISW